MGNVLIIGAGASKGNGVDSKVKPPLIDDFFRSDVFSELKKKYLPIFDYIDNKLGLKIDFNRAYNIEKLFGYVEGTWNLGLYDDYPDIDRRLKIFGKQFFNFNPSDWLRSLIIDTIIDTTRWINNDLNTYLSNHPSRSVNCD